MNFKFAKRKTAQRIQEMQDYYQKEVMSNGSFLCKSYQNCIRPLPEDMHFYKGQLSHVGKKYDLTKNGKPLRIVVSGIEYGRDPSFVTMKQRFKAVVHGSGIKREFYVNHSENRKKRNPHMLGTTLILKRILLGEESVSSENFRDWDDEFIHEDGGPDNHIFNMYAMVNFLLCSRIKNNTNGHSTRTMRRNCYSHYYRTLKILEPNLIVFQSKGKLSEMLKDLEIQNNWKPLSDSRSIGRFKNDDLDFITCEFTHPAFPGPQGNWSGQGRPYFQETVLPTIHQALKILEVE